MASLLHLTAARNAARIRRAGIAAASVSRTGVRGVYCSALLPSFTLSHQWARELVQGRGRVLAAVHLKVPDDEPVTVGHYSGEGLRECAAAQAVALIAGLDDSRGWEIFLARAVAAREVHAIRPLARPVGWRYFPGAHGRRPCTCLVCLGPGQYGARSIRRKYGD